MEIQKFKAELIEQCADLYISVFSKEPWNETYESRDLVINFIKNNYNNNYFIGFVAIIDGKVVGVCIGCLKYRIYDTMYQIDEFYVDTLHQRKGIGTKLFTEIKKELKSIGVNIIFLETTPGYPAQYFYEHMGFVPRTVYSQIDMYCYF